MKSVNIRGVEMSYEEAFDEFWRMYDYKVGKTMAEKKFEKLKPKEIELVFDSLPEYIQNTSPANRNVPGKQFRAHASTWLNQRRWEDEDVVLKPNKIVSSSDVNSMSDEEFNRIYGKK